VAVAGNFAYVADTDAGLKVINVSNPAAPVVVGTADTPGIAYAVAVAGSYAYVADAAAGLQVINISTPSAPVIVGTADTPGLAYGVALAGSYAYVADEFAGLTVVSITNPSFPHVVSGVATYKRINGNGVANDVGVAAITIEFQDIRSFEIDKGRYFSPFEASSGKNVAILGAELARRLFDKVEPVGKTITIAGFKTTVIGVLKKEGKGGISDDGLDELTLVPLSFGKSFINMRNQFIETQLMIKAKPEVAVEELSDETTMILRAARSLHPEETSDFSVNRASMLSQGLDSIFVAINIGGWVIGGFSILVGGFGIANIMFVSVRERTNIIGIQKALGAKKFFILQQFLVESMLLSIIGGLLGVFMIFMGTVVVNYLWDLNMYLTVGNIILALFISGIIGIVAGYAPANTAAKMNPVEAIGFSF
jgi:putative ABC transport system permease protein